MKRKVLELNVCMDYTLVKKNRILILFHFFLLSAKYEDVPIMI